MGEQADAIVNGEQCELCSQIFEQDHGYPVVCNECWNELTEEEKQIHQKAVFSLAGF